MGSIRLGLFQESADHFVLAIRADTEPTSLTVDVDGAGLRASVVEQPDRGLQVLLESHGGVEKAQGVLRERIESEPGGMKIEAGLMALDTTSDSWLLTVLPNDHPAYHVALAFAVLPIQGVITPERIIYGQYALANRSSSGATWRFVNPALLAQCAEIFFGPGVSMADACALLSDRHGVIDYLAGLGDTFSLRDIEQLAAMGQTMPSMVVAMGMTPGGEEKPWWYEIKMSRRAIDNAMLLPVSYARAKSRRAAGLHASRTRPDLTDEQVDFRDYQIKRFAHHLAVLELCQEYGIGLASAPGEQESSASAGWSVAVDAEGAG